MLLLAQAEPTSTLGAYERWEAATERRKLAFGSRPSPRDKGAITADGMDGARMVVRGSDLTGAAYGDGGAAALESIFVSLGKRGGVLGQLMN